MSNHPISASPGLRIVAPNGPNALPPGEKALQAAARSARDGWSHLSTIQKFDRFIALRLHHAAALEKLAAKFGHGDDIAALSFEKVAQVEKGQDFREVFAPLRAMAERMLADFSDGPRASEATTDAAELLLARMAEIDEANYPYLASLRVAKWFADLQGIYFRWVHGASPTDFPNGLKSALDKARHDWRELPSDAAEDVTSRGSLKSLIGPTVGLAIPFPYSLGIADIALAPEAEVYPLGIALTKMTLADLIQQPADFFFAHDVGHSVAFAERDGERTTAEVRRSLAQLPAIRAFADYLLQAIEQLPTPMAWGARGTMEELFHDKASRHGLRSALNGTLSWKNGEVANRASLSWYTARANFGPDLEGAVSQAQAWLSEKTREYRQQIASAKSGDAEPDSFDDAYQG